MLQHACCIPDDSMPPQPPRHHHHLLTTSTALTNTCGNLVVGCTLLSDHEKAKEIRDYAGKTSVWRVTLGVVHVKAQHKRRQVSCPHNTGLYLVQHDQDQNIVFIGVRKIC